jgi:hypothetical protein
LNDVQPRIFCVFLKKYFKKGGFGEQKMPPPVWY